MPGGVALFVPMDRTAVTLPPGVSTADAMMNSVGPSERRGETVIVRARLPAKLPRLASLTVEVSFEPTGRVRVGGVADMVKSTTLTVRVAE